MSDASPITTVKDLINLWPTRQALADEVSTTKTRVDKWARSDSIPAWYHARVLRAGSERGFAFTAADLVRLHDRPSEAA